jgi:pyridoxamine 5'-phosphate oxidase
MNKTPRKSTRLRAADLESDPISQFTIWYQEAEQALGGNFNAMTLATLDGGAPNARIVLLRGYDKLGFRFYSNYASQKGHELQINPAAAVVFHWAKLGRQVRVRGQVEQLPAAESDDYFGSRTRPKQIGAWASRQSARLTGRSQLEQQFKDVETRFGDSPVPRPPNWGGYLLIPYRIEFWQSEHSRLHDRFQYDLNDNQSWAIQRLSP